MSAPGEPGTAPRPGTEHALPQETSRELAADYGRALLIGAFGTIPVVGPVVSSVVAQFVPEAKFQRVERFCKELGGAVVAVEERLDTEFVKRTEFSLLFEDVLDRTTRARNDGKLAAFAAFAARSMTRERPAERERERYLDLLDELRPRHLRVLAAIASGSAEATGQRGALTVGAVAAQAVAGALAGVDADPYLDVAELVRRELLYPLFGGDTSVLLHVADDVRALLTPAGSSFVEFITVEALARAGEAV